MFFYFCDLLSGLLCVPLHEVLDQHRNVFLSVSKRRHVDRENIQPVEEVRAKHPRCDGRLQIAATNRDLKAAIASGVFRSDLFYRLNVFPIHVPPLGNRKEDIPMLVEYFVKRYAEKARKQITKIEKHTLELCRSYPWPGNIRELQNIIERSVIFCTGDTFWIDPAWLSSQD